MPRRDLAIHFEDVFKRLLARENVDLYAEDVSLMFEEIAATLLGPAPGREGCYFDGVDGLASTVKSPRQVQFTGEMWVGGNRTQWLEPLRATVTDKRCTKQGIWIVLWIGNDRAEGELSSMFIPGR